MQPVDEATDAIDELENENSDHDSFLYSVPPQVSKYFSDFGRAVRKMQFEAAAQVMHRAVDASRQSDGFGYGRNASEVASWKEILNAFALLSLAEGLYIQLPFLLPYRQLTTKRDAEMKRQYNAAIDSFHRIAAHLLPGTVPHHICQQALAYCEAREALITAHRRIVSANESVEAPLDTIEDSLQRVCNSVKDFHHPLLSDLAHNFALEAELMKSMIGVQRSVLYTGILETTIRLKELRERLEFAIRDIDWGNGTRRGLFSPSLKPMERWCRCRLFAYLHTYHAWLTLKYTFLFAETLGPYVNPLDAPKEGDASTDGLTMHEALAPIKKREPEAVMTILIDRSRDGDMSYIAGRDYKCPRGEGATPLPSATTTPSGKFPVLYMHASDRQMFAAHYEELQSCIRSNQQPLDEGKRVWIQKRESGGGTGGGGGKERITTYFYERLESRLVVAVVIPARRAEKDPHISRFLSQFVTTFRGGTLAARWRHV